MRIPATAFLLILSIIGIAQADDCTTKTESDQCQATPGCEWSGMGGCSICKNGTYKSGETQTCTTCPDDYPNTSNDGTYCYKTCETIQIDNGKREPSQSQVQSPNNCEYTTVCNTGDTTCQSFHVNGDACVANIQYGKTCENGTTNKGLKIYNGTEFVTYCTPGGCKSGYEFKADTSGQITCNESFGTCEPATFTITYLPNGGTPNQNKTQTVTYGGDYTTLASNTYTRTGYTFDSWGETKLAANTEYTYTSTTDMQLPAQWSPNKYTVKYNSNKPSNASNSVTGQMTDTECTYDTDCNLSQNNFKLTGWTFTNWNSNKNGTGTTYTNSVKNLTATNNGTVTIYAQWTAKQSSVTYNCGNGAHKTEGSDNSAYSATATFDSNFKLANGNICTHPTRNFAGWRINNSETTYSSGQTTKWSHDASNVSFTAQWSDRSYTCTLGKYLESETEQCTTCPAGYYCPGFSSTVYDGTDVGLNVCPLGMTSDTGASAKNGCYISTTTKFTDNNGAKFDISKFGTTTKYYYGDSKLPWHSAQ